MRAVRITLTWRAPFFEVKGRALAHGPVTAPRREKLRGRPWNGRAKIEWGSRPSHTYHLGPPHSL